MFLQNSKKQITNLVIQQCFVGLQLQLYSVLCTPPHCLAGLQLDSGVQWTFNRLYYIWQLEQLLSNFLVGVRWTSGGLWTNYCCWLGFRLGFGFRLGLGLGLGG